MNLFKIIDLVFILAMSLLLVCDFFPNFPFADSVPSNVVIPLILVLMVLSILFNQYKETNKKNILKWQLFWTIYIILLVGLLTVLGGQSKTGIALENGFLWVAAVISLVGVYSRWRKLKNSDA